jgi:hypothetical protein
MPCSQIESSSLKLELMTSRLRYDTLIHHSHNEIRLIYLCAAQWCLCNHQRKFSYTFSVIFLHCASEVGLLILLLGGVQPLSRDKLVERESQANPQAQRLS